MMIYGYPTLDQCLKNMKIHMFFECGKQWPFKPFLEKESHHKNHASYLGTLIFRTPRTGDCLIIGFASLPVITILNNFHGIWFTAKFIQIQSDMFLVGGFRPLLKNMTNRQLGWWNSQYLWESHVIQPCSKVPVTTNQLTWKTSTQPAAPIKHPPWPCQAAKLLDPHLTTGWSFHRQLRRKFRTIGNDFALVGGQKWRKDPPCANVIMHHEMGNNMNLQELCQPMCIYIYIYAYIQILWLYYWDSLYI